MQWSALMARKLRIECRGAIYHVMSRGYHGNAVFHVQADRELLLKTVGQLRERTGWLIHAFALMGNDYESWTLGCLDRRQRPKLATAWRNL